MKRSYLGIVLLLAVLLSVTSAFAAPSSIELQDLNLKLTVPEGWFPVTRQTPATDSIFSQIGYDGSAFLSYMNGNDIYLDAIKLSPLSEIVVTKVQNDDIKSVYDLGTLSEAKRNDLAKQLMNSQQAKDAGLTYTNYSLYSHKQAKFIVMDVQQTINGVPTYGRQYCTVVNGYMVNITMHCYGTAMTTYEQSLLQSVVEGVSFTKITKKPFAWDSIVRSAGIGGAVAAVAVVVIALMRKRRKKHAA